MKASNYPKNQLKDLRGLFLNIGLITALLFSIVAFEWESKRQDLVRMTIDDKIDSVFYVQVPQIPIPEPPKPKMAATQQNPIDPEIIEVDKPNQTYTDVISTVQTKTDSVVLLTYTIPDEIIEPPMIGGLVDFEAAPEGGFEAFSEKVKIAVSSSLKPHDIELLTGKSKKMFVEFIIEKDGKVSNVKVLKGLNSKINKVAAQSVENSGTWKPAQSGGRSVRQIFRLPISINTL